MASSFTFTPSPLAVAQPTSSGEGSEFGFKDSLVSSLHPWVC